MIISSNFSSKCAASGITVVIYVLFQVCIILDGNYSENPMCSRDLLYANWTWYPNVAQSAVFVANFLLVLLRTYRFKDRRDGPIEAYLAPTTVIFLGTVTSLLGLYKLANGRGGVCVDAFGVPTPSVIWAEWISCAPLLMYIAVATDHKLELSKQDKYLILCFFLSMLFGFFCIFEQPFALAIFWLLLSNLTYLCIIPLVQSCKQELIIATKELMNNPNQEFDERNLEMATKKLNLCNIFIYWMPLYMVIYFFAMAKILDKDYTRVAIQFMDASTKLIFALLTVDTYREVLNQDTIDLIQEKKASAARRNFLRYIFHEVRVPLNSLVMGIEILRNGNSEHELNEEELDTLIMMKESALFMRNTLNDVLSMQKIEEGKLELEINPFSVVELVNGVLLTFQGPAADKAIHLKAVVSSDIPQLLMGDRFRLEHVLANLLSNALKFSPAMSHIDIEVSSRLVEATSSSHLVTFAVKDQGPGISEENQKKLFTSFMQINPGETQQGRGTGVGLAICKQMVLLHGGGISCVSNLDCGSTFSFTVPLEAIELLDDENGCRHITASKSSINSPIIVKNYSSRPASERSDINIITVSSNKNRTRVYASLDDELISNKLDGLHSYTQTQSQSQSRTSNSSQNSCQSQSHTINMCKALVVDDVISNRKMLKILLTKRGLQVDMAEDGREAVDTVMCNPGVYDIIFMDNLMPNMNGVEATKILRQEGYDRIIVGVTGCALDDDFFAYTNAGADIVLSKPIQIEYLDKLIAALNEVGSVSRQGMVLRETDHGKFTWLTRSVDHYNIQVV